MRRTLAAAAFLLVAHACAGGAPTTDADPAREPTVAGDDGAASGELGGDLTVFAAASLTDVFEELGETFEAVHPDVRVHLNLAGSSTLAVQLSEGAPADVFASANTVQMDPLVESGRVEAPVTLTRNVLAIAVAAGNPLGIATLEDLARDDVVLVLASPQVPAGDLAARMLAREDVEVAPASLELDVRAALARVELGEADAAVVYRSDLTTAADTVAPVPIPPERNLATDYPIAVVADAANPDAAAAWVDLVTGPEGRAVLAAAGFELP